MANTHRFSTLALFLIAAIPLLSQSPAAPRFTFDAASIKPGDPGSTGGGIHTRSGGLFISTNTSLRTLIGYAYNVRKQQMTGGPSWLDSATFSIEAKPDGSVPFPSGIEGDTRMHLMMQSLLADRFNLAVHWETREGATYELTVAKGGPKLHPTSLAKEGSDSSGGNGRLTATGLSMSQLVQLLTPDLGRPVSDKTGLTGRYDLTLTYTPEARTSDTGTPVDPNDASIFTAVQEQLGLKLVSTKGPIEFLVIDHVDKPQTGGR